MRIRHLLVASFAVTTLGLTSASAKSGQGYTSITAAQGADHEGIITEFFSYESPKSRSAWQKMSQWKVPSAMEYERVPYIQRAHHAVQARGYYASLLLDESGKHEAFQRELFEAIQVHGESVTTIDQVVDVARSAGYDAANFKKVMQGAAVKAKVKYAQDLAQQMQPRSLPTLIVDGRYRTDGQLAGNADRMIKVLDSLVGSERDQLASTKR
ncbi:MAG: DsbA family protein [Bradymonadia bacterium]